MQQIIKLYDKKMSEIVILELRKVQVNPLNGTKITITRNIYKYLCEYNRIVSDGIIFTVDINSFVDYVKQELMLFIIALYIQV